MVDPVETVSFLRGIRLFQDLSDEDLTALSGSFREHALEKGQVLFRQGDDTQAMFLVHRGTIVISKTVTGSVEQVVGRAAEGDIHGEMALFGRQPWTATFQAEVDSTVLVLDRDHLQDLIARNPRAAAAFLYAVARVFAERV